MAASKTNSKLAQAKAALRTRVFLKMCRDAGVPAPIPEYVFRPTRKWRMDFGWPEHLVGLEVDGGTWIGGRHTRGTGWQKDTEKLNAAAVMGYRMLRVTPQQLCSSDTIAMLKFLLQ